MNDNMNTNKNDLTDPYFLLKKLGDAYKSRKRATEDIDSIIIQQQERLNKIKLEKDSVKKIKCSFDKLIELYNVILVDFNNLNEQGLLNWNNNEESFSKIKDYMLVAIKELNEKVSYIKNSLPCDGTKDVVLHERSVTDLTDIKKMYNLEQESLDLIVSFTDVDRNRSKPILRSLYRKLKEYIGLSSIVVSKRCCFDEVLDNQLKDCYKHILKRVERAKILLESVKRLV